MPEEKLPYKLVHLDPHHAGVTEKLLAHLHAQGYRLQFVTSDSYIIQDRPLAVGVMALLDFPREAGLTPKEWGVLKISQGGKRSWYTNDRHTAEGANALVDYYRRSNKIDPLTGEPVTYEAARIPEGEKY